MQNFEQINKQLMPTTLKRICDSFPKQCLDQGCPPSLTTILANSDPLQKLVA